LQPSGLVSEILQASTLFYTWQYIIDLLLCRAHHTGGWTHKNKVEALWAKRFGNGFFYHPRKPSPHNLMSKSKSHCTVTEKQIDKLGQEPYPELPQFWSKTGITDFLTPLPPGISLLVMEGTNFADRPTSTEAEAIAPLCAQQTTSTPLLYAVP